MKRSEVWKTKDGKVIPIKDLENSRLINILRLIKRKCEDGVKVRFGYCGPGDNLDIYYDEDIYYGKEALAHIPEYPTLIEEAKKRGLKLP